MTFFAAGSLFIFLPLLPLLPLEHGDLLFRPLDGAGQYFFNGISLVVLGAWRLFLGRSQVGRVRMHLVQNTGIVGCKFDLSKWGLVHDLKTSYRLVYERS